MDVHNRYVHAHDYVHHQLAVAALAATLILVPLAATAQVTVEVSPLRVEVNAPTGGVPYTQAVTVTNRDKNPVRIRARVDDWYLSKDGTPQFVPADGTMPYSAASWTRVNPGEQVAQPGETVTVRFTVTTPAGTAPAGYRAAIMFEFGPPVGNAVDRGQNVMFRGRVATVVYVTIGSPKPAVEVVDVRQASTQAGRPPTAVATLKNTGRVHVRTKGQMLIYSRAGTLVRKTQLPDVPVLPESERDVIVAMVEDGQEPLAPGQYRVEFRIDVGLAAVLVGETTVTIGK